MYISLNIRLFIETGTNKKYYWEMSKRKSNNDQRTLTTKKIVAEEKISPYHPKATLMGKNMIVPKTKEDRREKEKMK